MPSFSISSIFFDSMGYLRYPYRQITVIPEGDDVDEFMGWASLSPSKMSQSERRQIKSPHHLTLIDRSDIGNLHAHVARRMRSFYLDTLSAGVITRIIFRAMRQIHLARKAMP